MKLKTLLVLCLMSLAIDRFGGIQLFYDLNDFFYLSDRFNRAYIIISNLLFSSGIFWQFGFPVFFGSLFPKTSRTTWLVWILAVVSITSFLIQDLWRWDVYAEQLWWWGNANDWIFDSIRFLKTFAWIFYGGLVFQKLTRGIDFSKFTSTSFKDWYASLSQE